MEIQNNDRKRTQHNVLIMADLFSKLLNLSSTRSNIMASIKEATEWFKTTSISFISEVRLSSNKKKIEIGKMYLFSYDPKTKEKLPYYDKFPLIFPIESYNDGFLGINLHYLPPLLRVKLLDALYDTINNNKMNDSTKLKISYQILKSATKFRYFQPCVKRYLLSHIRSGFKEIEPTEWNKAILLPTQKFEKASESKVYQDSIRKS